MPGKSDAAASETYVWTASEYARVGMLSFLVGAISSAPMWVWLGATLCKVAENVR